MGLIDSLFGSQQDRGTDTDTEQTKKYAVVLNAGPSDPATAGNAFNYAIEFDDAGYETALFLDGNATKWPEAFEEDPDRAFNRDWERVRERGLLAGACGYCASAFEVETACERAGVSLLTDSGEHAPSVPKLAEEEYEILTVG